MTKVFKIIAMAAMVSLFAQSCAELKYDGQLNKLVDDYLSMIDHLASVGAVVLRTKADAEILKMVRDSVTEEFKDPESAKFRNERVFRTKVYPKNRETGEVEEREGIYVCGEVNGKNSYGAYVGYRDFWSNWLFTAMEDDETSLSSYVFLHYCFRK